jgi:hypothetical protein
MHFFYNKLFCLRLMCDSTFCKFKYVYRMSYIGGAGNFSIINIYSFHFLPFCSLTVHYISFFYPCIFLKTFIF